MKLHMGVVDIPYVDRPVRGRKSTPGTKTTGDIAEILEDKYAIMETYFDLHSGDIAASLEGSMAGALESLLMGAPRSHNPFGTAESEIIKGFHDFIENREMETLGIPGIPTQAALDGVNHRKKNPRTGIRRPSFKDTGQYMNAFTAWIE